MIVLYKGAMGTGKSLTMVLDAYLYFLDGYRVLSNIHLNFGEYITNEEIIKFNKESDLYNCVLVLDELQLIIDSRNFGKESNKSFSYFIMQLRKRNIILLGTAQYADSIEKRFRQNLDCIVSPQYFEDIQYCMVSYIDITLMENINFHSSMLKPVTFIFDATQVFPLYDTTEMLV